ncbi:unnamed protein product [Linum tenue]|uniref:Uncharacterized protein n=1 Tax=Linum tenue TaxID=586396 RepID=A0AAV0GTX9_9ROSI|nr:unnamed protein product [Linum tenue]
MLERDESRRCGSVQGRPERDGDDRRPVPYRLPRHHRLVGGVFRRNCRSRRRRN